MRNYVQDRRQPIPHSRTHQATLESRALFPTSPSAAKTYSHSLKQSVGQPPPVMNSPGHFIVATKDQPDEYQKLFDLLKESNQSWAQSAPVMLLAITKTFFDYKQRANPHARHDLGLALSNMLLQATDLNLYAHPMAGFSRERARETYHIPERYDPVVMFAFGYLGNPDQLDEDDAKRETKPRVRKPLNEFVYFGDWEQAHPWIED